MLQYNQKNLQPQRRGYVLTGIETVGAKIGVIHPEGEDIGVIAKIEKVEESDGVIAEEIAEAADVEDAGHHQGQDAQGAAVEDLVGEVVDQADHPIEQGDHDRPRGALDGAARDRAEDPEEVGGILLCRPH